MSSRTSSTDLTSGHENEIARLAPRDAGAVAGAVARLLECAVAARVSDLHLLPTSESLELSWRIDGVLQPVARWPAAYAANVVSRLKVLADLLTYRTDLPQEGRLRRADASVEMRLSTFPTLHGEKAVVRLFVGSGPYETLEDLGLPEGTLRQLRGLLEETSGCLVLAGPAGSGKTTTVYACLREIQQQHRGGKSIVTLEDPIEAELPGVTQSQVHRPAEFTYGVGLRSLMRQDPDVILVGEIRDRETAETVFQASLTGHLVLTTFHAGSAAQAVTRLRDLGVEPYLLGAGLRGILCQRLLRRCCECLQTQAGGVKCEACWQTGYRGRVMISELLVPDRLPMSLSDLGRLPADELQELAAAGGMTRLAESAAEVVASGATTLEEVVRVLGVLSPTEWHRNTKKESGD